MRNLMIAGALLLAVAAGSPLRAQTNTDDVAQLKQRVAQLEKQVQDISQLLEPIKAQQALEKRRAEFHKKFEQKMAQDAAKYTQEQLREAEQLYQVANQKWGTPEASESLQKMIEKFPDANRTGCAVLYLAQSAQGDDRAKHLQECIEKHDGCFYGDGVQVGAYARYLLVQDYRSQGNKEKAEALENEIKTQYAGAIDHAGNLLVDSLKTDSK